MTVESVHAALDEVRCSPGHDVNNAVLVSRRDLSNWVRPVATRKPSLLASPTPGNKFVARLFRVGFTALHRLMRFGLHGPHYAVLA